MRTAAMLLVVAILLCLTVGCGSVGNLQGQDPWFMAPTYRTPMPFGGVVNDGRVLVRAAQLGPGDGTLIFSALSIIDLPLSLGADIITLPWATYEFLRETKHPKEPDMGHYPVETPTSTQADPTERKE